MLPVLRANLPLLLMLLGIVGCTTLADVRYAQGQGQQRTFPVPYEEAWEAAVTAMNSVGLPVVSASQAEGVILGETAMSAFSYGENVAIFVEAVDDTSTSVEVVSKRALSTTVFATDWAPKILDRVAEVLDPVPE